MSRSCVLCLLSKKGTLLKKYRIIFSLQVNLARAKANCAPSWRTRLWPPPQKRCATLPTCSGRRRCRSQHRTCTTGGPRAGSSSRQDLQKRRFYFLLFLFFRLLDFRNFFKRLLIFSKQYYSTKDFVKPKSILQNDYFC